MRRTVVTSAGDVVCPRCGARNQFVQKRTGKAKLAGVATAGVVGVAVMPKRLKCNGCGTNLKRGKPPNTPASPQPWSGYPAPVRWAGRAGMAVTAILIVLWVAVALAH